MRVVAVVGVFLVYLGRMGKTIRAHLARHHQATAAVVGGSVLLALSAQGAHAGEGVVAVQTADPSCKDSSGDVYVDCGNGTVTDNRTGLVWLKNANCLAAAPGSGAVDWRTAMEFAAGLSDKPETSTQAAHDCGLADHSSPGEWRLPSVEEWEAMIADAVALGCVSASFGGPSITGDSGATCWQEGPGNSFTGVANDIYWSASTDVAYPTDALGVTLDQGFVGGAGGKDAYQHYVWPVRGGQ